jgi:hypothetical protein
MRSLPVVYGNATFAVRLVFAPLPGRRLGLLQQISQ